MPRVFWIICTFSALLIAAPGRLAGQAVANTPLHNFRMPLFNEFGHRVWDLRATSLRQLGENVERIELTSVHLRLLAGDPDGTLEAELFAPQAVVDHAARTVSGRGQLHVIGRNVELFGDDWICHADAKSIVIERAVVVTFSSDLGNILQ
jgi:hypothetical protein